jgi:hypothetical protein
MVSHQNARGIVILEELLVEAMELVFDTSWLTNHFPMPSPIRANAFQQFFDFKFRDILFDLSLGHAYL